MKTQEAKNVTSDFEMFKVGSSSVVKENDHLKVSIETESKTYDKIYIGSKADIVERKDEKAIVGTGTSKGYLFTFELPLSADGTDVAFVPHSQERGWVSRKADGDYTLHISLSAENKKDDTENPETGRQFRRETNQEPEVARIRKKMRVLIRPYLVESMQ